jgi:filamentous hemagglutinin family protein
VRGLAQGTPSITQSGLNTQVDLSSTPPTGRVQYDITGGTRAGANLFHSFGNFNVPDNNTANFLNNTGLATSNIIGRVTDGNISNIFGTIQTTGFGQANLYLMNPAGIVFGPNATLNVGGSVAFTTADYLRLNDKKLFHAIPNAGADALLSTAPVVAYGFLKTDPGTISVQGSQLTVTKGHDISLVGGSITIQNGTLENGTVQPAHLSATQGHINLATSKSPGEFLQNLAVAPNVSGASFRSYGSAHFESGSILDGSQTGNAQISIRGGQLVLEIQRAVLDTTDRTAPTAGNPVQDTLLVAPGSAIVSRTSSSDSGPHVTIRADQITLLGHPDTIWNQSATSITSSAEGSGDAGNIALRATENIGMTDVINISSTSLSNSAGNAGNVELSTTHGHIQITNSVNTAVASLTLGNGKTGKVSALAPEGDIVLKGANLFTSSSSSSQGGGHVEISAKNLYMTNTGLLANDNESAFKPDGITVALLETLRMESGSLIVTSSINNAPSADITLTAKDIVTTQGSIINNATFASGPGGQLKIVADTLHVTDGAQLSSGSTRAPNRGRLLEILGSISPSGQGGDITIQTLGPRGAILIDGKGSGIFADTEGTGAGGSISLTAGKSISVSTGGVISANSTGSGNAGSISINAGQQLELTNGALITTTTKSTQANGGNIEIRAIDRVRLVDSTISTSVQGAQGSGGNIFIDPKVVALQGSNVTAQAIGGSGGNITFVTPLFLADSASLVSASSERGPSGTVSIQSPTSNLSGTVGQLTAKTSPPQVLLQNRCVASARGEQSTFILAGRDSLPAEPGGWLSSPVSTEHETGEDLEHVTRLRERTARLNESPVKTVHGMKGQVLSLRRLTPPGFLVRTFASGSTGCPS